ncbi:hypothetical protein LIER_37943 [Lithospermum erythrorhizon]|uniref:Uncharacterized protein n=1 Tax=Lithospermum erythrorhizon TaxID=34254 RepID=A0AAV3PUU5_LITER
MAKYGGLYRSRPCGNVAEARGRLDKCHPGWTALKPRQPDSFVFFDYKPQSYEDVTFFLSLRQIVRSPSFEESTCRSKDYQAWLDTIPSSGSISSPPRIPGRGKGLLIYPSLGLKRKASPVSVSEDRNPKHVRGVRLEGSGSTRAASHEMSPRSIVTTRLES